MTDQGKNAEERPQGFRRMEMLKLREEEQRKERHQKRQAEKNVINKTDVSVCAVYQMNMGEKIDHEGVRFINESQHMLLVNVVERTARRENAQDAANVVFVEETKNGVNYVCVRDKEKGQ